MPSSSSVALKEWAVTVQALESGHQTILLRKGGIREAEKNFKVLYPEFLLYPTYEHQKADLLKEAYRSCITDHKVDSNVPEHVTFTHWASVQKVVQLSEQDRLKSLSPYHIWANHYVERRFHWKPRQPLTLMLLRVYRLECTQRLDYIPRYGGCKSWVQLEAHIPLGAMSPVMTDGAFDDCVSAITKTLEEFTVPKNV